MAPMPSPLGGAWNDYLGGEFDRYLEALLVGQYHRPVQDIKGAKPKLKKDLHELWRLVELEMMGGGVYESAYPNRKSRRDTVNAMDLDTLKAELAHGAAVLAQLVEERLEAEADRAFL